MTVNFFEQRPKLRFRHIPTLNRSSCWLCGCVLRTVLRFARRLEGMGGWIAGSAFRCAGSGDFRMDRLDDVDDTPSSTPRA